MMILLQQNKKRREPGKKCHARNYYCYDAQPVKLLKVFFFSSVAHNGSSYAAASEKLCEKFSTSRANLVIVNSWTPASISTECTCSAWATAQDTSE
jgi:hypothetical protein